MTVSSGWQENESTIGLYQGIPEWTAINIYISSIVRGKYSMTVVGKIGMVVTRSSTSTYITSAGDVYVTPMGGAQQKILDSGEKVYGGGNEGLDSAKTVDFITDVSITPEKTTFDFNVYTVVNPGTSSEETQTNTWTLSINSIGDNILYGSVNNMAEKTDIFYGSVSNQAVACSKVYGSVGGQAKLIHQGFGHLTYT